MNLSIAGKKYWAIKLAIYIKAAGMANCLTIYYQLYYSEVCIPNNVNGGIYKC